MIDKRLLQAFPDSMPGIRKNIFCQWIGLLANTALSGCIAWLIARTMAGAPVNVGATLLIMAGCIVVRLIMNQQATMASFSSSTVVKEQMRDKLFSKLAQIGPGYLNRWSTAEIVQLFGEGVDQLETYFGSYIPQFFYALLAPLTLFVVTLFLDWKAALVLLVCVPLIPASIIAVQKFAKKLLGKYWGQYTQLGDSFLENLQGLTTLKIYEADGLRHQEMNEEAEKFRKITMRVLTMQLNSISVMDLVAYGGAAAGILVALGAYQSGTITLFQTILIVLLSAEFFLPMRTLGSYFHIAMNGMAASAKMFAILDEPVSTRNQSDLSGLDTLALRDVDFAYEEDLTLQNIDLVIEKGKKTAIVGESGSGKSTIAKLLLGQIQAKKGTIEWNGTDLNDIQLDSLYAHVSYLGHESTLFKGTVRDNLRMADPTHLDEALWSALQLAGIAKDLEEAQGLDTLVEEGGANFSGGQRQRIALARLLLKSGDLMILDEATSNVDVETEDRIMQVVRSLRDKTVLCISHRLKNIVDADVIYVLQDGRLVQQGTHDELVQTEGRYATLWNTQQALERYSQGGQYA
ncbi:ABC transporter ATP-binding protein/permease [uncultured Dubosiella sp.]|uniref:ABC transporter ATP-binding protein/permease n=1 Tax=uncultured Dubosiella sp. TaxID=1937011 RepID=UPI0025B413DB|nr:ABC transporter ATP-binding protein/permease [uncultured Dubosiella sp.]